MGAPRGLPTLFRVHPLKLLGFALADFDLDSKKKKKQGK